MKYSRSIFDACLNYPINLNKFHQLMSNKNISLPHKYKCTASDETKTINKETSKMAMNFTTANKPKYDIKNYKPLHRAGSDTELRRNPTHHYSSVTQTHLVSAEEEYYSTLNQNKIIPTQSDLQNRNFLKETASTSSIDHRDIRRASPRSSPAFITKKQQLKVKIDDHFKTGHISKENFRIIKKLGEGKFGKVYMVVEKFTHFVMAMKVLDKVKILQDGIEEQFIRELKIQVFLNHPNIIDIYGFFHDETCFYILQELGCDGQLYNLISQHQNLTEEATSFIVKNLLESVHCLHSHKILHRDIKPENIVLIMGNVKLCDFGWAVNKIKKEELRSTFCGTPLYLSPELLKGQKYDEKVDLWAIGILSYELLMGCSPFQIFQQQDLYKILTEEVRFPNNCKVSAQFQEFIGFILNKDPKQRLESHELLKLPFIRKYEDLETCEQLCR